MYSIKLNEIKGIEIGHAQDWEALTGCSVVICRQGAVGGVNVRGGAPGTRETDLLQPEKMIDKIHAIVLAGGSAYGLDAASGVMEYLEEQDIGFDVGVGRVPIVPSSILFDLNVGDPNIRPDKSMGYQACKNIKNDKQGNIGAGTGATVGKVKGPEYAMKGGLGVAAFQVNDLKVGALFVMNCLGDVIDPQTGDILAGTLTDNKKDFADTKSLILNSSTKTNFFSGNTTLGIVVTNASLDKVQTNQLASYCHNGLARTLSPAHTQYDGDTIFTMATGNIEADYNLIKLMAEKSVEKSIINGIKKSSSLAGYPAFSDISFNIS